MVSSAYRTFHTFLPPGPDFLVVGSESGSREPDQRLILGSTEQKDQIDFLDIMIAELADPWLYDCLHGYTKGYTQIHDNRR